LLGPHHHAVLARPTVAENALGEVAQALVIVDGIERRHALILRKPGNDISLRFVEKLFVVEEVRVIAEIVADAPVQVIHQLRGEEILDHREAVPTKVSQPVIDTHALKPGTTRFITTNVISPCLSSIRSCRA
jgi:hypothetical protein